MLYQDSEFADLFPTTGQRALSPGQLALTTVMQFAEGLSDREIAGRLSVIIGTVKAHNNSMYGKLGVSSRMQALNKAQALGLL